MVRDPYVSNMMQRTFQPPTTSGGTISDSNALSNAITGAQGYTANAAASVSNIGGFEGKVSLTTLSIILLAIVGFYLWTHGYQA